MNLHLVQQPTHFFSGNPVAIKWAIVPFNDNIAALNLHVVAELRIGSEIISTAKIFPDENGILNFDPSSVADCHLTYFTPPANLDQFTRADEQYKIFLCYAQLYNGTVLVDTTSGANIAYTPLYKGGFAYDLPPSNKKYLRTEFSDLTLPVSKDGLWFLNQPERIFKEDLLFLCFITDGIGTDYKLYYTITALVNDEEINYSGAISGFTYSPTSGHLLYFPAGFDQLELNSIIPVGSTPIKYTLTVKSDHTIFGAPVLQNIVSASFILDQRKFYNSTQLLYRNSLGGLQSIRLLGQKDVEADYNYSQAISVAPPSYMVNGNLLSQIKNEWPDEVPKFSGNTGFISKFEADRIRDFFLSREIYEVRKNAGSNNYTLIPVVVNKSSAKFYSVNDSLFSIDVDWRHSFANNFYSIPDIPAPVCPMPLLLKWFQTATNKLTILWQLPFGYDYCKLTVKYACDNSEQDFFIDGNSGSTIVTLTRPPCATGVTASIIVSLKVVCERYNSTPSLGSPLTLAAANILAEVPVVCTDDYYRLPRGYNPGNTIYLFPLLLANDFDPDGGTLEAVPATGSTAQGGLYEVFADGSCWYGPPSSAFAGADSFPYLAKRTGGVTTTAATAHVTVY